MAFFLGSHVMQRFTRLFLALDQSHKTTVKVQALVDYFAAASAKDKLRCIALLADKRPKTLRSSDIRLAASHHHH